MKFVCTKRYPLNRTEFGYQGGAIYERITTKSIVDTRLFQWHLYDGGFWFRLFGRGLSVIDKSKHKPLFSERNGYRKVLRIGKWGVEIL